MRNINNCREIHGKRKLTNKVHEQTPRSTGRIARKYGVYASEFTDEKVALVLNKFGVESKE